MKKHLTFFVLFALFLCVISRLAFSVPFDGWVWKDLTPQQRTGYVIATIRAAKELPLQQELGPDITRIFSEIVEGLKGRTVEEMTRYINAYYKTREDLYTPVVQVLHKYAKENIRGNV